MTGLIDQSVLEKLCPELRSLLDAEIARGNSVNETSASWGLGGGTVWLLRRSATHALQSGVEYNLLQDPHHGYAEYVCRAHGQVVIAGLSI